MQFTPRAPLVVVKFDRKKQRERKEKEGSLYLVTDSKDEARNLQVGEIVDIGVKVPDLFPQAKIGSIGIFHWMVESKDKENLIFQDETFNYYLATATECLGRVNELYGIIEDGNIIPSPEYIFLKKPHEAKTGLTPDEYIEAATQKSEGGLFLFNEWVETRTDKEEKMAKINAQIQSLTKTKMNEQVKMGIKQKEAELATLSADINKTCTLFYEVAAINPILNEEIESSFGKKIEIGERIALLNIAAQTTVTVGGTEYIIALSKHIQCTADWAERSVKKYKSCQLQ